jgi:DNA-binding beta-propeller fold protein YncE
MRLGILDFRVLRRFNPFMNHYENVVSKNTDGTDSTIQLGSIPSDDNKLFGPVATGTHVYFIPDRTSIVYKIDVVTKVVSSFSVSIAFRGYNGGVLGHNGKIYCIPKDESRILVIDPTDDSHYFITGLPGGTLKWQSAAINEEGIIYCSPRNNSNILKINTNNDTFTLLPHTTGGWWSGTLAQDGIMYFLPFSDTTILKIDTKTDTVTEFGSLGGTAKWNTAIAYKNFVYGIPYRSSVILKIDTKDDSITTFGAFGIGNDKWVGAALLENGFIYGCPSSRGAVLKLNPEDDTSSEFGSLPTAQAWRGIANGGNGALYCAPSGLFSSSSEDILEITNDGITEYLNEEFIKSGYSSNTN